MDDTIVARATAPGRGAIALVRLSGPAAFDIARTVTLPWPLPSRMARLVELRDPRDGALIDRAIVIAYDAPHSYTGEDVVEFSTHGGHVVPATLVSALVGAGAREALPGEFTRRAVLNGRMDLVQAEAVGDLIDARSRAMQRSALAQLDGGLSRRLAALRAGILEIEALIAYDIDFPEEDDGPVPAARILDACERVERDVAALLATSPAGELIRDGALVVIAGAPNAGKSSLFNALLGRARAIVTPEPGTTRDAIEAVIEEHGWPLRLVDTAGLRETSDTVERLGIEVSERYLAGAHVVLACGERLDQVAGTMRIVGEHSAAPVIPVHTKSDLRVGDGGDLGQEVDISLPLEDDAPSPGRMVGVSAETGEGLRALTARIAATLNERFGAVDGDAPVVTRARHQRGLATAQAELAAFRQGWVDEGLPAPVAAVHLRAAASALEELIGAMDVEDVLGRLFSTFCVGK